MSALEKRTALALKAVNASLTPAAIAKALRKRKHTVACFLHEAREKLQAGAPMAAEHVLRASAIAAMRGDAGPAQWILEHVSAKNGEGADVRVVDPPKQQVQSHQGVTVNIGIGVGSAQPAPSIDVQVSPAPALLPTEAEQPSVTDSKQST